MTVRHDRPAPGAHLHQKAWERSLGGPLEARSISPPPPPPPGVLRCVLKLASICPGVLNLASIRPGVLNLAIEQEVADKKASSCGQKNKQASKKTNKHHHHHHHHHHHPHHQSLVAESRALRQGFSVHTENPSRWLSPIALRGGPGEDPLSPSGWVLPPAAGPGSRALSGPGRESTGARHHTIITTIIIGDPSY